MLFRSIPPSSIALTVAQLPIVYIARLLRFVALQTEESPHLEFGLLWIKAILDSHGQWVADNRGSVEAEMRTVSRAVGRIRDELRRLADENVYTLDYLLSQPVASANGANGTPLGQKVINGAEEDTDMEQDDGPEWIGLD